MAGPATAKPSVHRMHIQMPEAEHAAMEASARKRNESITSWIRRAASLVIALESYMEPGSRLLVARPDGSTAEVVMPGLNAPPAE